MYLGKWGVILSAGMYIITFSCVNLVPGIFSVPSGLSQLYIQFAQVDLQ